MIREVMTREEVEELSVVLKRRGLTVGEIISQLSSRGLLNASTGRAYGHYTVNVWCRGVFSQRGYRKPCLVGLSLDERSVHDAEMRSRQLSRMRIWRERHPGYGREYMREYNRL